MTPYYADAWLTVYQGDCREVLPTLEAGSVDAIVTDPPYDLTGASRNGSRRINNPDTAAGRHGRGFMGHEWDGSGVAFQPETWEAMLRVARPGAWLLTFGGTRTHHRLAVAVEDAGWELTDELAWIFAQGMPKGRTTLKPAHEPILLARKPAPRVTPLQIDETRIPTDEDLNGGTYYGEPRAVQHRDDEPGARPLGRLANGIGVFEQPTGRWPANVVLTDPVFDGGYEGVVGGGATKGGGLNHILRRGATTGKGMGFGSSSPESAAMVGYADEGTYSRYFLISKAGRRERNAGLEDVDERPMLWSSGTKSPGTFQSSSTKRETRNHHPTVKPIELMSHLVRLVCPPGGTVLDPFIGSGSTAVAAVGSGRKCIGIELDETYLPLIAKRLRLLRTAVPA